MYRIYLPLIGSGTDKDPFRADWPTYSLVAVDYDAMECVVDIPQDTMPAQVAGLLLVTDVDAKDTAKLKDSGLDVRGATMRQLRRVYGAAAERHQWLES